MDVPARLDDFKLALLRRGVDDLLAECERCDRCHRTPLIGERIYCYSSGAILCALCKPERAEAPVDSRLVMGSEFGHTVRITDRRGEV